MKFVCEGKQPLPTRCTEGFAPWCVCVLPTTCFRSYLVQERNTYLNKLKKICVFKKLHGHLVKHISTNGALLRRDESGIEHLLTPLCHPIISPLCTSLFLCFILFSDVSLFTYLLLCGPSWLPSNSGLSLQIYMTIQLILPTSK